MGSGAANMSPSSAAAVDEPSAVVSVWPQQLTHCALGASWRQRWNTGVGRYWKTKGCVRLERSAVSILGSCSRPTQTVAGRATVLIFCTAIACRIGSGLGRGMTTLAHPEAKQENMLTRPAM